MQETTSKQFSDPYLVAAYDALNALGDDSDFFCSLVKALSAQSIIDLGCGTGLLTCRLAELGYTVIGIEPAEAMLELARHKPHADKVRWIEGGYEKFEGFEVDLVLMTSHVAQFFLDDQEWLLMLKAAHKALVLGGHIVFDSRRPIFPPYQNWPTETSRRRVIDSKLGPIDWWYQLVDIKDNLVSYKLFYHFINSDEVIVSEDKLLFRSQDQLCESLRTTGFQVETIYGSWDGSLATPTSEEMIFVASKGCID